MKGKESTQDVFLKRISSETVSCTPSRNNAAFLDLKEAEKGELEVEREEQSSKAPVFNNRFCSLPWSHFRAKPAFPLGSQTIIGFTCVRISLKQCCDFCQDYTQKMRIVSCLYLPSALPREVQHHGSYTSGGRNL